MGCYTNIAKLLTVFIIGGAACSGWTEGNAAAANRPPAHPTLESNAAGFSEENLRTSSFYGGTQTLDLLNQLQVDCSRHDLRLTHETNAEDLDGNRSTSFFVNGDPHHYVVFYRYNKEHTRISKIRSLYGTEKDSRSPLIRSAGPMAFVYFSSGPGKDRYSDQLEAIFDVLVKQVK